MITGTIDINSSSKDLVIQLKEINFNQSTWYITKNDKFTAFMLNYIPMVAQSSKEV